MSLLPRRSRALLALLASMPLVVVTNRPAAAAGPAPLASAPLPHGIHRAKGGRYYQDVCDHDRPHHCLSHVLLPATYHPGAPIARPAGGSQSPDPVAMGPSDVAAAYSLTGATGGGIVAIEDFPDSTALDDVNTYRKAYGIAPLSRCTGAPTATGTPCFAEYDENGNANPAGLTDGGMADIKTALDMDMVSAACPNCSIVLVEWTVPSTGPEAGPNDPDYAKGAAVAATVGANALSISWSWTEAQDSANFGAVPGKLVVFASSGDSAYDNETLPSDGGLTPSYPASNPNIFSVGGTTLQRTNGVYSEVVWNDAPSLVKDGLVTGSGCSIEFPMPAYQTAFLATHPDAFGTCTMRATNDLSAVAEFGSSPGSGDCTSGDISQCEGINVYSSPSGGFVQENGTSVSAPMVAAIFTRLGVTAQISSDLGFLYENIAAFNDVTTGTNDNGHDCTNHVMCNAGPGWDGPTGVGTPNGAHLAALVGSSGGSSGSDAGTESDAAGSGGGDGGSGDSSSGGNDDAGGSSGSSSSGGSEDAGGPSQSGGDSGSFDGGASGGGGNSDTGGTSAAGCGCRTVGDSSAPIEDTKAIGLFLGAAALVRSRRRKQCAAGEPRRDPTGRTPAR